jgi:phosphomannomutase
MAARHGVPYSETLTGFKWLVKSGDDLVFGYEEALGYCVAPNLTRDKDGISAALLVALLAATLKRTGSSLTTRLDEIAREYGLFATDQLSIRVDDISRIAAAVAALRAAPPTSLGDLPVTAVDDFACGIEGLPQTDALRYRLDGSGHGYGTARVVVRPSGTEPKLKCYLEVVIPVSGDVDDTRAVSRRLLAAIRDDVAAALGFSSR